MTPHVPFTPWPFFVAVQAWQDPEHAESQQTPSTQKVEAHSEEAVHDVPLGKFVGAIHAPDPLHSLLTHSLSGSVPVTIGPHVPSAPWPFFAAVQAKHGSLQEFEQQTPSTQNPEAHCAAEAHTVPFGAGCCGLLHEPEPVHSPLTHSLSGSVFAAIIPQTPLNPDPFFAVEHAAHAPVHTLLQQTPSTQ
jgi:hypothetical protein